MLGVARSTDLRPRSLTSDLVAGPRRRISGPSAVREGAPTRCFVPDQVSSGRSRLRWPLMVVTRKNPVTSPPLTRLACVPGTVQAAVGDGEEEQRSPDLTSRRVLCITITRLSSSRQGWPRLGLQGRGSSRERESRSPTSHPPPSARGTQTRAASLGGVGVKLGLNMARRGQKAKRQVGALPRQLREAPCRAAQHRV